MILYIEHRSTQLCGFECKGIRQIGIKLHIGWIGGLLHGVLFLLRFPCPNAILQELQLNGNDIPVSEVPIAR